MANKTDFVKRVAEKGGYTKEQTREMLEVMVEALAETLKEGDSLTIGGLGKFTMNERAERMGRNPQTGEEILIPARKVPHLKIGRAFRELCN